MHTDKSRPAGTIRAGFSRSGASMSKPKHDEPAPSDEMKRMFERLCHKPAGRCVGVHNLVPIFEVDEIPTDPLDAPAPSTQV